jgi:prepilin-type N-terminal cleavage/methylation domain-containing protein
MTKRRAFTLVELLVVIAIIGLLSTIAIVALVPARAKARDAKRLADMRQIQTALNLFYENNGYYPNITDSDPTCGGWDVGFYGGPSSDDVFIPELAASGLIKPPGDPLSGDCSGDTVDHGYIYYRYPAGSIPGCEAPAFYVLGVADMETSEGRHPSSPGWKCPTFDWNNAFEWVTGGYER